MLYFVVVRFIESSCIPKSNMMSRLRVPMSVKLCGLIPRGVCMTVAPNVYDDLPQCLET